MDVPLTFRFPFEPYSIQLDFMKNVYQCLEQGKLGVFESPTGTVSVLFSNFTRGSWLVNRHFF